MYRDSCALRQPRRRPFTAEAIVSLHNSAWQAQGPSATTGTSVGPCAPHRQRPRRLSLIPAVSDSGYACQSLTYNVEVDELLSTSTN
ncbi:hypothetical protein LMH87_007498 [Akanthomyces muscarius]|uniref:Uncharacterized protein n=1 Tax=Akanthomyces muscarius TaxID=2231603 RepID=A0A9W8QPS6_AKAMU|nr:hypothetical protein LMH87_007498 [Akanthomyces muscarius]KAJ4165888.1 hypothetical protein LMH87_007498 [Akanthomyces muscarius]